MLRKISRLISRFIEGSLVLLGIVVAVVDDELLYLALWDLLAIIYLAIRVGHLRAGKREAGEPSEWLKDLPDRRSALLFTMFASFTGVGAALTIVAGGDTAEEAMAAKVFAVPAVLLAWAILHFGYAERYARDYYAALPERILDFPGTERPAYPDFVYFSFTLGTSFAVSDVETLTTKIRRRVLAHTVLAFLYNTATLGVAVGVITGK
ncbi:DUF1345 domain-containing protein [Amycolatopsis sp. NPDC059021]|uniref:DUF1345 domain-containing protein n=1 Tax=Amycolatopsis sp. NPDC059021 TaxID=3346704 RepID=UPI0036722168